MEVVDPVGKGVRQQTHKDHDFNVVKDALEVEEMKTVKKFE